MFDEEQKMCERDGVVEKDGQKKIVFRRVQKRKSVYNVLVRLLLLSYCLSKHLALSLELILH